MHQGYTVNVRLYSLRRQVTHRNLSYPQAPRVRSLSHTKQAHTARPQPLRTEHDGTLTRREGAGTSGGEEDRAGGEQRVMNRHFTLMLVVLKKESGISLMGTFGVQRRGLD